MRYCSYPEHIGASLSEYIDNKLDNEKWRLLSEHIATCEVCQQEMEQLRMSMEALQGLPQSDPGPAFNAGVLERLEMETSAQEHWERRMLPRFRLAGAFAVLAFVALIAIPLYVMNIRSFMGRQDVYIIGKDTLIAGSRASVRVVVSEHGATNPIKGARVRLYLESTGRGGRYHLLSGRTNSAGTLDGSFRVPDKITGSYRLIAVSSSSAGRNRVAFDVKVKREVKLLLTTDKPVYQPGQTVHIRTLSLLRPDLRPAAGELVEITVEDPKQNRIFRKRITASRFGVAAADFQLGDEINLGHYKIKAAIGGTKSEKTIDVKRYVLPKFKIELKTDKSFYGPNETLKGTVTARYFFGKPVNAGSVRISLKALNVNFDEFDEIKGKTNADGVFSFQAKLPNNLPSLPHTGWSAQVKLDINVTDSASHTEEIARTVIVSPEPIRIAVVPESGQLEPGLENIVYVVTSYPDGRPARTITEVSTPGYQGSAQSDELGIAAYAIQVPGDGGLDMRIHAADGSGKSVTKRFDLQDDRPDLSNIPTYRLDETQIRDPGELGSVLIRTDKAVYQSGDTAKVAVMCTRRTGAVYIDAVRDGQTILTKTAQLTNGAAQEEFDLSKDFSGTVTFSAYVLAPLGVPVRDTATVLVREASELKVSVEPDRDTYRPGDTASLRFRVTDHEGKGVVSAIGLDVVDESVFSVEEQAPGLAALYFALQEDILKPRYQIKELDLESDEYYRLPLEDRARKIQSEFLKPAPQTQGEIPNGIDPHRVFIRNAAEKEESIQRAARVLFAGAVYAGDTTVKAETAAIKDRKAYRIQSNFIGDEMPTFLILIVMTGLSLYGAVTACRLRKARALWLNIIALLLPLGLEILSFSESFSDALLYYLGELIILLILGYLAVWIAGIALALKGSPVVTAAICLLVLILLAAILFPVFARAREAARMSSAAGNLREIGAALDIYNADSYNSVRSQPQPASAPGAAPSPQSPAEPVRVRQFFPETLFSAPEIITEEDGTASVEIPIADSITTWRVSALASSLNGKIGSATAGLKVFQEFFVDPDLPVALTRGDKIKVPIAVYNYSPQARTISLTLSKGNWFNLEGPANQDVQLGANQVGVAYFPMTGKNIGKHTLTVTARSGELSDAIKREVTVWPNGQEQTRVMGGRISGIKRASVMIPEDAIAGASRLLIKVYPGAYSHVVEGLESLLQVPHGCFEQTSSITYPNVLVLQYLKTVGKNDPKVAMKAEQYINLGYQRILTFEVPGGGFDWYGSPPANTVLTAYGIMELADMAKVHDVDSRVIKRAVEMLASRQKSDGSWDEDEGAYTWGKVESSIPVTAYVTWALAEAGQGGLTSIAAACDYLKAHLDEVRDPYVLALVANALVAADRDAAVTRTAINRLVQTAVVKNDRAKWASRSRTLTYGSGDIAGIEATALAAYALIKHGSSPELAEQALNEIVAAKRAGGYWGTTQATILALKALVLGSDTGGAGQDSQVEVLVNGAHVRTISLSSDDAEIAHTVDATRFARTGKNNIELRATGKAQPAYQLTARYYVPWSRVVETNVEPVSIQVEYTGSRMQRGDVVTLNAHVSANRQIRMAIVDLGVPPGFAVMTEDLDALKSRRVIDRYELTGRQIILYVRNLSPGKGLKLQCRLRAQYPVTVSAPSSSVYDYYNPESVRGIARPIVLSVN